MTSNSWRLQAACLSCDPNIFFVGYADTRGRISDTDKAPAMRVCARCPVTDQCLDEAMGDTRLDSGIWGGLTASRRIKLRRATA